MGRLKAAVLLGIPEIGRCQKSDKGTIGQFNLGYLFCFVSVISPLLLWTKGEQLLFPSSQEDLEM